MRSLLAKSFRTLRALKGGLITLAAILVLTGGAQARSTVGPEQGRVHIEISKSAQRMIVYVDGEKRMTFRVSTGRQGYATPSGTFHALAMKEMHYSKKYDNAPMPHSIFFRGGYAIHATNAVGSLGRPASHGCVRLSPRDAAELYALVAKMGMRSVSIHIA